MTTYNYNSELIKAMNEKLPNGTNLANTLIDMLYLGKEAVYRRLRGEVPFTLAEAAAISQKMGVSLDKLAGTNVDSNAIFDLTGDQFATMMNIKGIPHFLLYSKDGTLMQYKADRPSSGDKIRNVLTRLK